MMVFRRRNRSNALRPINRIKHVLDTQFGLVLAVQSLVRLAITTDAPSLANTTGVETGSTIRGIYLNVEVSATTAGALANVYMMVAKNPGANITFPNANVVGADDNKRYVIHQEMRMLQKATNGNPRSLFNGVIVIPRGYQRNAPNDELQLLVFAPGVNCDVCVQCHYKEFR